MEDRSPKCNRLNFSKTHPGRLFFQTVKLSYYFQEAKCKTKKPSLQHTLLQKVYGLQNIHLPTKRKQTASKEMRIKYFSHWVNIKTQGQNCLQFLQFLPNPAALNKNPLSQTFPHKTSWHQLDIGHFYRPCFWRPLQYKYPKEYLQSYVQSQEQTPEVIVVIKLSFCIIRLN